MPYKINFSDPLRATFQIQDAAYNGPGGGESASTLRLYGKGALLWGESVDENMLRMLENFAGATPPYHPNFGQLWAKQELYWRNSTVELTAGQTAPAGAFFRFRFEDNTWQSRTTQFPFLVQVVNTMPVTGGNIGQYIFHLPTATLYRWDSPYEQMTAQWMPRAYTLSALSPSPTTLPRFELNLYALDGTWSPLTVSGSGGSSSDQTFGRIDTVSTPRQLVLEDAGGIIRYSNNADGTFIVPHSSTTNYAVGSTINLRQVGTGKIRLEPADNVTINLNVGFSLAITAGRGSNVQLIKVAPNEWDVNGDFQYS